MNTITLRDYQQTALDKLADAFADGKKRIVLCAPTGAGKTVLSAKLLQNAHRNREYALFLVDRIALLDQTSAMLDSYGIPHGIVQASHPRWSPYEYVQVCSIQTLARRNMPRMPRLIIYDECHCQYKTALDFIRNNPEARAVGLTATPFAKGMGLIWDDIITVRTTGELMDLGFLVRPKIYACKAPSDSEMSLGHDGEFTDESITRAQIRIVGDVVGEWERRVFEHFGGPRKTLVFCATVAHGAELVRAFAEKGYRFCQISYMDKNDEYRRAIIEEFRKPDSTITGLISCGVLTKGFDVPDSMVGISCRPYRKSFSGHIQEIGRVLRPAEGKNFALWLCHSRNIRRFLPEMIDFWENGPGTLSQATELDRKARNADNEKKERLCKECGGVMIRLTCSVCGHTVVPNTRVTTERGDAEEIDLGKLTARVDAACNNHNRAIDIWTAALAWSYKLEVKRRGGSEPTDQEMNTVRRRAYVFFKQLAPQARLNNLYYNMAPPSSWKQWAWVLVARQAHENRKKWAARKSEARASA